MTARQRRLLSASLGAGLLLLLLLIVSLDNVFEFAEPQVFEMREVSIYQPPPPPPPPPQDSESSSLAGSAINLARTANIVALDMMDLDVKVEAGGAGDFGAGGWGIGEGIGAGLETFDLSELDSAPVVIGAPPIVYPEEAVDQGVAEFLVRVHILIDEEGRTYLVRIVENPFPSFSVDLQTYVSAVIFTPPKRFGVAVRAEYLWPLRIRQPTDSP